MPENQRARQRDQQVLRRDVAEPAAHERADERRHAHGQYDAQVHPPGAQVEYRAGQGCQAADQNVRPAGGRRRHPQEQHGRQAHGAQGQANKAAENADEERDNGQQSGVPDQDLRTAGPGRKGAWLGQAMSL